MRARASTPIQLAVLVFVAGLSSAHAQNAGTTPQLAAILPKRQRPLIQIQNPPPFKKCW